MTDPVRGEFRVTGSYYPHPGSTPIKTMLTGVVVADGVPPTPGEHLDLHVRGEFRSSLPVLVDRADPTRFVVLWDEVPAPDPRADARRQAEVEAQRMRQSDHAGSSGVDGHAQVPVAATSVSGVADLPPWLRQAVGAALDGDAEDDNGTVTVRYGTDPTTAPDVVIPPGWRRTAAVLTSVTDVPVPVYALPGPTASLCDLAVRVTRPDGSSYLTSTRMGFRSAERRTRFAVVGSTVPVGIDPADETHLAVDIPAWDVTRP